LQSSSTEKYIDAKGGGDVVKVLDQETLPVLGGSSLWRQVRWQLLSTYRKIFTVVFVANTVAALTLVLTLGTEPENILTAVSINLLLSVMVRNEHFINVLFAISVSVPQSFPLWIRKRVAKVYSYGGLHSGCGVGAVVWYIWYCVLITQRCHAKRSFVPLAAVAWTILLLLAMIIVFAHPKLRAARHDHFEMFHRFAGWTVVVLFWAQMVIVAHRASLTSGRSIGNELLYSPSFWCLILLTLCIIYPWARLRLERVRSEELSEHAMRLHFDDRRIDSCMAVRISDNPLRETHAFAVIPEPGRERGFSVIVSRAGDWTSRMIEKKPEMMWVKGAPAWGVIRVATMFKPVVIVATGSGIGPCLGLFNGYPSLQCRVLWSTPCPEEKYGRAVMDTVLRADPNAVIIDTRIQGRQDMSSLTYKLYKDSGAEAVVVISNPKLTKELVFEMESRNIPAYGPIWDS